MISPVPSRSVGPHRQLHIRSTTSGRGSCATGKGTIELKGYSSGAELARHNVTVNAIDPGLATPAGSRPLPSRPGLLLGPDHAVFQRATEELAIHMSRRGCFWQGVEESLVNLHRIG